MLALVLAATVLPGYAASARPAPIGQDPYLLGRSYHGDFPDPSLLRRGQRWFAYATTTAGLNLPVLTSTDLRHWHVSAPPGAGVPDAMPRLPQWARARDLGARRIGQTWAPSVVRLPNGRFADVYTLGVGRGGRMCISVARSKSPRGPFVDRSARPLVCPLRGAIDPAVYRERTRTYLLYKTEDAAHGQPTRLWIRRISPWLTRFLEPKAHLLLKADPTDWEHGVVEAPSMIRFRAHRYLFYSGNGWGRRGYSTGYALCPTVEGPCTRPVVKGTPHPERLLVSGDQLVAPGGASAFLDASGRLRLAFHAWNAGATRYPTSDSCRTRPAGCGQRRMHFALLAAAANGILRVRSAY